MKPALINGSQALTDFFSTWRNGDKNTYTFDGFEKGLADLETKVSNAAKSVSEYYYKYCNYDSTYSNPYYRSPYGVFCAGIATCSGTTRAMGRVLDYMGYSWTHVNENQYTHQWNEFYINGQKCWADGMMGFAGIGDYPY